jgi:hypothetical protein
MIAPRADESDAGASQQDSVEAAPPAPVAYPIAYVILSGRLALIREIDSYSAASAVSAFVAENYDRYRMRAVARGELEAMTIVARWLRERDPADGRLIYLNGASLEPGTIIDTARIGDASTLAAAPANA